MSDVPQRPTSTDDRTGWISYWKAQGMPWRTEPEIDAVRQSYLSERRAIKPDVVQGIYPFRDESGGIKLTRADVEWLLTTHESSGGMYGPVNLDDEKQRFREGLDIRGADLRGAALQLLPLARSRGSLEAFLIIPSVSDGLVDADAAVREMAKVHLEQADMRAADLRGVRFRDAHLEGAILSNAQLQWADLSIAHLTGANLLDVRLQSANLGGVALGSQVAHLEGARLDGAVLDGTRLTYAKLHHASLRMAHLEGANLAHAELAGADLRRAVFDERSTLDHVQLSSKRDGSAKLGDVKWNGIDLTLVEWHQVKRLGDEVPPPLMRLSTQESPLRKSAARLKVPLWKGVRRKDRSERTQENDDSLRVVTILFAFLFIAVTFLAGRSEPFEPHRSAARAYRRLSMTLREQGMADEADRFAYRAQVCQRRMLFRSLHLPRWLLSWLLCLLAGYGYKPGRALLCYVLVLLTFAWAFFQATHGALGLGLPATKIQPLAWYEATVLSISSFHGRGFFQPLDNLGDPVAIIAAVEAIFGLVIEVSFIATFTQRFFAR